LFKLNKLEEFPKIQSTHYVSDVRIRQADNALLLYVPRNKVSGKINRDCTSERQLKNLQKKLANKYDLVVEIIYTYPENQENLESACYQILNQRFKNIKEIYLSFLNESTIDVWIAVDNLTSTIESDITASLNNIVNESSLTLHSIQWVNPVVDLPTYLYILNSLKIHQPIKISRLTEIISKTFSAVNEKWLNKNLDTLRKKKFLIREKTGFYQVSERGLAVLPNQLSSNSSDVQRALALGKRKW